MRIALAIAAAIAALAVIAAIQPADAATKKKKVTNTGTQTVVATRPRSRITVYRRSYLDAGTEVLPGERKFLDYALPPHYSPLGNALGPGQGFNDRQYGLPSPWDLPGIGLSF